MKPPHVGCYVTRLFSCTHPIITIHQVNERIAKLDDGNVHDNIMPDFLHPNAGLGMRRAELIVEIGRMVRQ